MENFIVSARKYRPDNFKTVVGQQSITSTLKNAIRTNHLAQAYLFCGPRGVGKTTCARILAKTINCENLGDDVEPCNSCESCISFNQQKAYNIHELDAASNNSVDDIRRLIEQVRIPPQVGNYSIYIIDEVHMLSQSAFNAFLKTLEEPPSHAIFILATTEKHKIIPTILSRCQIFDFNRIQIKDTVEYLEHIAKSENIEYDFDALNVIAQKSDGGMRDALSIFDQIVSFSDNNITYQGVIDNLNVLDYEYFFKLTDAFLVERTSDALLTFDEILDKGFDGHNFINGLAAHFRDLLVCKDAATIQLLEVGDNIKDKYKEQAAKCSPYFLLTALRHCSDADLQYKMAKNKRLHIELALINISNILSEKKKSDELAKKKQQKNTKADSSNKEADSAPQAEYIPTISLKEAFKKQEANQKGSNRGPAVVKEEKNASSKEFTEEAMLEAWKGFLNHIKGQFPRFDGVLPKITPVLKGKFEIVLKLPNSAAQEQFAAKIKQPALNFIGKHLECPALTIKVVVNDDEEDENTDRLYTDQDKFKYLVEKNPNLDKLKQLFNLDFGEV
jgi:DNA polymerase-3 subunit gamma/tau